MQEVSPQAQNFDGHNEVIIIFAKKFLEILGLYF